MPETNPPSPPCNDSSTPAGAVAPPSRESSPVLPPQDADVNLPMTRRRPRRQRNGREEREPADGSDSQLWTPKSLADMLDIILSLRGRYDNGGGSFKSQMWRVVKDRLEQQGHVRSVGQIKNKVFALKAKWQERAALLGKSGFGIDPRTKKVTASDECWECLVQVSVKSIRKKEYTNIGIGR